MTKTVADPDTKLLEYRILDEFGETFWDSQVKIAAGENVIFALLLVGLPCTLTARIVLRPAPTRLPSLHLS